MTPANFTRIASSINMGDGVAHFGARRQGRARLRPVKLHFDLPLDALTRKLRDRALRSAGAPFDPADGERFGEGVKRVWRNYQAERERAWPLLFDRALHRRDREE